MTVGSTPAAPTAPATPTALAEREAALVERERRAAEAEATARKAEHASFCEGLAAEGRLLESQKGVAVELLGQLSATSGVVNFSEGGGVAVPISAAEAFKKFLAAQPKVVDFGEATPPEGKGKAPAAVGGGYQADPDRADLDARISNYAEKHGVDYATAFSAVVAQEG